MSSPLDPSRRKVVRANEHIANIEIESGGFFASKPYSLIVEPDPDSPNQEIHKLRFNEPLPEIIGFNNNLVQDSTNASAASRWSCSSDLPGSMPALERTARV